jgi:spore coat protein H
MKHIYTVLFLTAILLGTAACRENLQKGENREIKASPGQSVVSGKSRQKDLDYVFDLEALPVVTVEISTNEWNDLLINYDQNRRNQTYVRANFRFEKNGKVDRFDHIGFRIRGGHWSRNRPQRNPRLYRTGEGEFINVHFRVSFNTYVESGRFYRQRNLLFKWHNQDPAYCREILSYHLFNQFGVKAACRASYARFYLEFAETGERIPYGVYIMLEPVDRSFLAARYDGDNTGHLWKCQNRGAPADLQHPLQNRHIGEKNVAANSFPLYDFKSHSEERGVLYSDGEAAFRDFVEKLNLYEGDEFENWIAKTMDVDNLLRVYTLNVLVNMWDDYWLNGNNYYLYRDSNGLWHFIPWDYDNTFGTSWGQYGQVVERDVFAWGEERGRPLMNKILAIPRYRDKYEAFLRELIDAEKGLFRVASIQTQINKWHALIEPYVHPDKVGTVPNTKNNRHTISDAAYGEAPFKHYRLLDGEGDENYLHHRIRTLKAQLGL